MNDRFEQLVKGVCPVIESPFSLDGSIDPYSFDSIVDYVINTGVTAALWPAFASEFYKLSDDEKNSMRTQFLQRTETAGNFIAIVGITQHSTRLAVDEARRAADQGAGALNVLPPYFLAPSRTAVLEHLSAVISAHRYSTRSQPGGFSSWPGGLHLSRRPLRESSNDKS
jgi:4-hydroxy-tetrahydrodipicolinate synthase